ncbi:molecular chaperone Hsp40/DnaJ family protein, partial [Striga asiatica]
SHLYSTTWMKLFNTKVRTQLDWRVTAGKRIMLFEIDLFELWSQNSSQSRVIMRQGKIIATRKNSLVVLRRLYFTVRTQLDWRVTAGKRIMLFEIDLFELRSQNSNQSRVVMRQGKIMARRKNSSVTSPLFYW